MLAHGHDLRPAGAASARLLGQLRSLLRDRRGARARLDREVENGDGLAFADLLVADLADRATVDASGARWSNVEYRAGPPELEPRPGWAMGNAGLVRELLRHARITAGRDPPYAVQWPDQPATVRAAAGRMAAPEMIPSEG